METGAELSAVAAGCGVAPPGPTATFLASASRRRNAARRADFACRLGGFPRHQISLFCARGATRAVARGMARAVLFNSAIRGTTTRTAALKSTRVGSNHQRAPSQAAIARVPPLENAHSRAPPNKAGADCVPLISPARAGKATIASNVIAVNTASTSATTTTTDRARGAEHIFLHELERQGAAFILPIITCFTSAFAAEYSKVEKSYGEFFPRVSK